MAVDIRKKNANWIIADETTGKAKSPEHAILAVLMDLRDELKQANVTLCRLENLARCANIARGFVAMRKLLKHVEKFGMMPLPLPKGKKPAKKKRKGK